MLQAIRVTMTTGLLFAALVPFARGEVVVLLDDGTRLVADTVEPTTDDRSIVLRSARERIAISRTIGRERVRSVQVAPRQTGGEAIIPAAFEEHLPPIPDIEEVDEFPPLIQQAPEPVPFGYPPMEPLYPPLDARIIGIRVDPLAAYADDIVRFFPCDVPLHEAGFVLHLMRVRKACEVLGCPPGPAVAPPLPLPPPVEDIPMIPVGRRRIVMVAAAPVSTAGKIDRDSLAVELSAVDEHGRAAPLRGTLRFTLRGLSQQLVRGAGDALLSQPGQLLRLAEWTRPVDAAGPVRLTLPLPFPLPDHDLTKAPFGDLHVQLLAPGVGTFETAQPFVVLRQTGPLRHRHLLETGSLFFPEETPHDSRR